MFPANTVAKRALCYLVWGLKGNCLCVCVCGGAFTYGSPNHYSCASAAHLEDYSSPKCHSFTEPLGHTFPGVDHFITRIDEDLYQIKGDEQGTHSHFCSPEAIPCPPGLRLLVRRCQGGTTLGSRTCLLRWLSPLFARFKRDSHVI